MLTLHPRGLGDPVETDIAGGNKLFFRNRGFLGDFFRLHRLRAADRVILEKLADYEYSILPQPA